MIGISTALSIGNPLYQRRGIPAAGVVQNQTAAFGADTLSGAGGYQITDSSGSAITNATDAGTGTATGYAISAGGIITPTSNGAFTGQDGGTIAISCDQGTATVTLAVEADAYHARTMDEIRSVVALDTTGVSLGRTVYLRDGNYNPTETDWRLGRGTDHTALWDGSNYTVIKAENAYQAIIPRLTISGTTPMYVSIEDVLFDCGVTGAYTGPSLGMLNSPSYVRVKGNRFWGTEDATRTRPDDLKIGVSFTPNTGGAALTNLVIENNDFQDVETAIKIKSSDGIVRGNTARRFWGDGLQMLPPADGLTVEGNEFTDKLARYTPFTITGITQGNPTLVTVAEDASGLSSGDDGAFVGLTGLDEQANRTYNISAISGQTLTVDVNTTGSTAYVSGGEIWVTGAHGDHMQGVFSSAVAGGLDNITFRGNRLTFGNGTPVMADAQGIFLSDQGAGVNLKNLVIEGNIIEIKNMVAGIEAKNPEDAIIRYNTVIQRIVSTEPQTVTPQIGYGGTPAGANQVYGNVSPALDADITSDPTTTATNNYILTVSDAAYAAAFDAPPSGFEATDPEIDYAPKSGGPIASLSPVPGAVPHQSFTSPWTFTEPSSGAWAPTDVSGLELWYDFSDEATLTGDPGVTAAADKSASGFDLVNGTASPTRTTLNALTALDFNGVSAGLVNTTDTISSTAKTIAVVFRPDAVSGRYLLANQGGGTNDRLYIRENLVVMGSAAQVSFSPSTGNTHVLIATSSAAGGATTALEVWLDGVSQGTGSGTVATLAGSIAVGQFPTGTSRFDGIIAEVIVYDSVLSAADRQALEDYLTAKWGV